MEKLTELKTNFYKLIDELKSEYDTDIVLEKAKQLDESINDMFAEEKHGKLYYLIEKMNIRYSYRFVWKFEREISEKHKLRIFEKYDLPVIIYYLYCWYNDDIFIKSDSLAEPDTLFIIVDVIADYQILYDYMKKYTMEELDDMCCEIYKNKVKEKTILIPLPTPKFPECLESSCKDKDKDFKNTLYYKLINKIYKHNNEDWDDDDYIGIRDIAERGKHNNYLS